MEAAYLSSTAASRELCHSIDPDYRLEASVAGSTFSDALQAFNAKLPADMRITVDSVAGASQKALSAMLDNAGHESRLQALCPSNQATLISECQDGAKDFWTAVPSKALGTAVPAAEFTVEIQYRLCMSQGSNEEASFCPLCGTPGPGRLHLNHHHIFNTHPFQSSLMSERSCGGLPQWSMVHLAPRITAPTTTRVWPIDSSLTGLFLSVCFFWTLTLLFYI